MALSRNLSVLRCCSAASKVGAVLVSGCCNSSSSDRASLTEVQEPTLVTADARGNQIVRRMSRQYFGDAAGGAGEAWSVDMAGENIGRR